MENNSSNYDMFDKLIANNKKAQSWTIFWVTALCLLAGAVLWMAFAISEKNKTILENYKTINQQELALQSQKEFLETKNLLIDSLVANCNVAKTEIVKSYDSAIVQTENALKAIVTNAGTGTPEQITEMQQNEIRKASRGIQSVKANTENIKLNIRKTVTRLFIQYNNKDNSGQVEELLGYLKVKSNYYIAPPEYIDNSFPTVIKFYNYKNDEEERLLKELVAKQFRLKPDNIDVQYESNPKIKSTIEIWIGTRPVAVRQMMIQKAN